MALALMGFACTSADDGDGQDEAQQTSTEDDSTSTDSTSTESESDSTSTDSTESTETSTETESTESEGTETETESTDTTEEGGSFYAGPSLDVMPDGAEPEILLDGPQTHMPRHGARHRLPE